MTQENLEYTKNTDVTEEGLKCSCGLEVEIRHCSNWGDGTGIFYSYCDCGKEKNVRWKEVSKAE